MSSSTARVNAQLFSDQDRLVVKLRSERNQAVQRLKRQRRRTDRIREAVEAYLSGESNRAALRRAMDDTDYSETVGE